MDVIGTPDRPGRGARDGRTGTPRGRGGAAAGVVVVVVVVVVVATVALVVAAGALPSPAGTGRPSAGVAGPSRAPTVQQPAKLAAPDLGIRGTGGTVTVVGAGVEGTLWVEVRNGGRPVRLAAVAAEVPGVRFTPRVPPNGATLPTDGLIGLRLGYVIEDCALVQQAGRILLTVIEPDGLLEIVLPVFDAQGDRRQSALDRVLAACSS